MQPSYGNSFVQAFIDSNKTLIKTLCIKSETSAQSINDALIALYGQGSVDKGTPRTWKYYLNISGEYHSTDTLMTVTSLDTLEEISFTKENLRNHSATAKAYQYGSSRYYYSLLNRYPEQEQLLLGILYPANIDNAIAADDGAILTYPAHLVEPQEQTLIAELEGFIQRHMVRWNVQAFGLTDSLYNTSYHAQLYLSLLPKLLNLRLARCKTNEAHSFHIRQYLASHGGLDRFLPYMTLKQALFFYRNICYLQRNTGKTQTHELLIQKILTDRQIPLAEYSIRHLNTFDDNYYPQVVARRKPVNDEYNIAEQSYVSTADLYKKENALVSGNTNYRLTNELTDDQLFKNSSSSVVQTKNLESNMVDYNDAVPDPLDAVLLRQWAHMASHDLYNVVISFQDPKTSEFRTLYTKDALIYFSYVTLMSVGIEVDTIPSILVQKYRVPVKPSIEQLKSVIDSKHIALNDIIFDIWSGQPEITEVHSSSSFYELANKIFLEARKHWFMLGGLHDLEERGALDNLILQFYADELVDLDPLHSDIHQWLVTNNLPPYTYSYNQAQELLKNIFTAATGLVIDETKILKNIQKNMLDLLGNMSSYTIQFIREINDSKIRPLNWPAVRAYKASADGESDVWIESNINIVDAAGSAYVTGLMDSNLCELQEVLATAQKEATLDIAIAVTTESAWNLTSEMSLSPTYLKADYPGYDPVISSQTNIIGKELYLNLTENQRNSIKSIYS